MPLPALLPLLGILGLGAGAMLGPKLGARAEDIMTRRRAQRAQGLDPGPLGGFLGGGEDPEPFRQDFRDPSGLLNPAVTPFDYNAEQIRSGLLAPEQLTDPYGIAQLQEAGAWDRAMLHAELDQNNALLQQEGVLEGRLFDLGTQFQPRFDALDTQLADLGEQDRIVTELLNMPPLERGAYLGTPEGIAAMNALSESEEREFSAYKRRVYGEAEPPPDELARLRESYFGALGGGYGSFVTGGGRMEQAREVFDRRAGELERQKEELTHEYQRNLDRINEGGVQTRGPRGGTDVTVSGRNAPPGAGGAEVGPAAMAIAEELLGAGEVPDRELLSEFMATGGEGLDPVTTAWCAAFLNAALAKAGGRGTGSNLARSFLNWGQPVDTPREGDVAVFRRGKQPWAGHAGFFRGYNEDGTIRVLGGNQGDSVSESSYPAETLLGFRRGR